MSSPVLVVVTCSEWMAPVARCLAHGVATVAGEMDTETPQGPLFDETLDALNAIYICLQVRSSHPFQEPHTGLAQA